MYFGIHRYRSEISGFVSTVAIFIYSNNKLGFSVLGLVWFRLVQLKFSFLVGFPSYFNFVCVRTNDWLTNLHTLRHPAHALNDPALAAWQSSRKVAFGSRHPKARLHHFMVFITIAVYICDARYVQIIVFLCIPWKYGFVCCWAVSIHFRKQPYTKLMHTLFKANAFRQKYISYLPRWNINLTLHMEVWFSINMA